MNGLMPERFAHNQNEASECYIGKKCVQQKLKKCASAKFSTHDIPFPLLITERTINDSIPPVTTPVLHPNCSLDVATRKNTASPTAIIASRKRTRCCCRRNRLSLAILAASLLRCRVRAVNNSSKILSMLACASAGGYCAKFALTRLACGV